jgi:hypothetical protein
MVESLTNGFMKILWDWINSNWLSQKSPVVLPISYLRTHSESDQNDILIYEFEEI